MCGVSQSATFARSVTSAFGCGTCCTWAFFRCSAHSSAVILQRAAGSGPVAVSALYVHQSDWRRYGSGMRGVRHSIRTARVRSCTGRRLLKRVRAVERLFQQLSRRLRVRLGVVGLRCVRNAQHARCHAVRGLPRVQSARERAGRYGRCGHADTATRPRGSCIAQRCAAISASASTRRLSLFRFRFLGDAGPICLRICRGAVRRDSGRVHEQWHQLRGP